MFHQELLPLTNSLISLGFFFPQGLLPFLIRLNLGFLTVGTSLVCSCLHLDEHLLSSQSCCTLGLFSPFSFGTLGCGFLTLGLLTPLCFCLLGLLAVLCFNTLGLLTLLGFNTLGLQLSLHLPRHVRHMTRHLFRKSENLHR